jgi:hypothetical protein
MNERSLEDFASREKLSRRSLVTGATFFGAAMAAIGEIAKAEGAGSGSYSNAAIALPDGSVAAKSREEQIRAVRIARAMRAGPSVITEHATVAEMDKQGRMTEVLRQGADEWVCMPGNEDVVGDPPMCVDALGMQWFKDLLEGKPEPTNAAPGLCYMLCGATQHSNTNAHDKTSPAIPIGPHWMILWPFDANHCGLRRQSATPAHGSCSPGRLTLICTFAGRRGWAVNTSPAMKQSGRCATKSEPPVDGGPADDLIAAQVEKPQRRPRNDQREIVPLGRPASGSSRSGTPRSEDCVQRWREMGSVVPGQIALEPERAAVESDFGSYSDSC